MEKNAVYTFSLYFSAFPCWEYSFTYLMVLYNKVFKPINPSAICFYRLIYLQIIL